MSPISIVKPAAWTLRAKIVASIVALFSLITLATGTGTVLLTRHYLTGQLDHAIEQSVERVTGEGHGPGGGSDPGRGAPVGDGDTRLQLVLRNGAIVTDRFGRSLNSAVDVDNSVVALSSEQIARLQRAGLGSAPKSVNLGSSLGTYRIAASAVQIQDPTNGQVVQATLFLGIPTDANDQFLNRLVLLVTGGTVLGLVLLTGGGYVLVRRNLEPLARVAGIARRVSTLKLDAGDVALAERVPPADTDPRTEVGQVGLALNGMLDNVDGALRARHESEMRVRQFVADASHELRTPLASIRGYAELSRREKEPVPSGVTHALSRVESEAQRMTSLVEDLLLLARLDEGRPLDRDEVDLSMIAINAVSDAHAASPDHTWQLDLPDEPVTVTGDRERLHQVLGNLLANARTHTPVGTRVVTSIRPEGGMVRLSVTDNGPGIPETLQRKVFERFTRGDDSRSRAAGSTGLGLSIVAAVGQAHGGTVDVESQPGQTRFSVLIPA